MQSDRDQPQRCCQSLFCFRRTVDGEVGDQQVGKVLAWSRYLAVTLDIFSNCFMLPTVLGGLFFVARSTSCFVWKRCLLFESLSVTGRFDTLLRQPKHAERQCPNYSVNATVRLSVGVFAGVIHSPKQRQQTYSWCAGRNPLALTTPFVVGSAADSLLPCFRISTWSTLRQ